MSAATIRIYDDGGSRLHVRWFCRDSELWGKLYEIGAPPDAYTVERIAITLDQVRTFTVQGHSLNEKDNNTPQYKREVDPDTCWELEALRPADLQEIIRDEILTTITDEQAWDDTWNTCPRR